MTTEQVTVPHDREVFLASRWRPRMGQPALTPVISPDTAALVCELPDASLEEAAFAVEQARTAFESGEWPRLNIEQRLATATRFRDALGSMDGFARAWAIEGGMPITTVGRMYAMSMQGVTDALDQAKAVELSEIRQTPAGPVEILHEPIGPVLAILTYNGPLAELGMSVFPALLTGNTVVVKLPPENRMTGHFMAEAAAWAGFPEGVLTIITAGAEVSQYLVANPDIDAVHFTGGNQVGAEIAKVCADRVARVTLELGGKSAAIVADDVDIDEIIPTLVAGMTTYQGQICVTMSRILVSRARHDELVDKLSRAFEALKIGAPLDPATQFGPLVSERVRARAEGFIERAVAQGATVATGGKRPEGLDRGFYLEPTLLTNVDNSMDVAQNEVFGPVYCIIAYDDIDDAVRIANDSKFGLYGAVLTNDEKLAYDVARRVRVGAFGLGGAFPILIAPYGGMKQSGWGYVGGKEGFLGLTNIKTIVLPKAA
jgi:acyl-CoA reductase-like NAD-dependent aldehyde dehydrogenase